MSNHDVEQNENQPVTRGEFRRWIRRATVGYIILAIGAVVSAALMVDVFSRFESETLARDVAIRASQIANCQVVTGAGSPNRTAIVRAIRNQNRFLLKEIEDNRNLPPEFFPNIPPKKFEQLVREGIRSDRGTIKANKETVAALVGQTSCRKRYKPLASG